MSARASGSRRRSELSPVKRALLDKRLQGALAPPAGAGVIPKRPDQASAPLSFAQERMWFLHQLDPGNPTYNRPVALRFVGRLDIAALGRSLSEIVRRHEVLRASFPTVEGQPVQVIVPPEPLSAPVVDLSSLPSSQRVPEARRLATAEAQRPPDLAKGPLFRATLLHLDASDHVLVMVIHHIAFDAWSASVLIRELAAIYTAFSSGQPSPLPELPIQYADYAAWQRGWLQGKTLQTETTYWKQQLEGAPPVLELPTDHPRPPVHTYQGQSQALVLPNSLTEALATLSQMEGATLYMTLQAALKILLWRLTGQDDLVMGTPIAGRNQPETEGLIGVFLNNLVLRTDLSGNPTFLELLARVRHTALGAYDHQDLPFERLLEELQPERDPSRTPIFQVYFNMILLDDPGFAPPGLRIEEFELHRVQANFDLTAYIRRVGEGIQVRFTCNSALFSQGRVGEMLAQYRHLLEQIVSAPEKPIRSYSLVTPDARAVLPDPCAVLAEPPQEPVTRMFTSRVERAPEQVALRQGNRTWTYRALSERAHALARALAAMDLAPGDVVAVLGPRSFGLIASMMGTLLSGCVLLPIDPTLPHRRQQLMLRETDARAVLHADGTRPEDRWPAGGQELGVLWVDQETGQVISAGPDVGRETGPLPELDPEDPAYIFFTSGTTGMPKGVLGCHKSLSHFLAWQRDTFTIGPGDRAAQLIGISFDAVLRDIFLPLVSGATLCLPEATGALDPEDLLRWLERERITIANTVPSLAQFWLAHAPANFSLRAMRWLFFAGEPLTEMLVRRWRAALSDGGGIINLYGPTETTLVKCFYQVPAVPFPGVQPAGWPMPHTQALVLTGENQLCGIGEPGEIVLRTPFRALGYVDASEVDQKRFARNAFRDDEKDLLYFTGDRGRYLPDGMLEILGRLDDQVKIRGVRVEPGEVTATLARYPGVEDCVVVGRRDERDETYLAAYVVPSQNNVPETGQLRSYLNQQLPAALVPTAFVFLEQLPLTPNGKVDRKTLPEPDVTPSDSESVHVAPRTPVEEVLSGIWTQVLGVERVGIHGNFFDLGGHSLLATRVMARVRERLQVDLTLPSLFEAPTIAGLAQSIDTLRWAVRGPLHGTTDMTKEREEGEL